MKREQLLSLIFMVFAVLFALFFALTGCDAKEPVGISSAGINENGELVLQYTDGSTQNLGTVVGEDGKDGANGLDGEKGKDGKDGEKGEKGDPGEDGADGLDGKNGADGKDGSITLSGAESSVSLATSKGMQSAVKITCAFTRTVTYPGYLGGSSLYSYSSAGAGVIYKFDKSEGDAFIITNYHVVYDSNSNTDDGISKNIKIYLYGSETASQAISATYVGGSLYYDIAVLHIDNSELLKHSDVSAVSTCSSDELCVGDTAIAIGNPENLGISASCGVVSLDSEYITMTAADNTTTVKFRVMRIDTAINSGNSGGGLFNINGELIGIVNAKISDSSVENIGYAIPSNIATRVADNIMHNCFGTDIYTVMKAQLGVTVTANNSRAEYNESTGRIGISETVTVYEVSEGSLTDGIIVKGDVINSISVGDFTVNVTRVHHVLDAMLIAKVGDTVTVSFSRGNESYTKSFVITSDHVIPY